jgi:plastocyanin
MRSAIVALLALLLAAPSQAADISGRVLTSDGEPLEDAVVFVRELPAGVVEDGGERTAVMDQINKEFVPHVLPVVVGTAVRFPNHDQIHHHVYSFSRTKMFEIPLYKGEEADPVVFDEEGAVKIGCNIHDWMSAVVLVLPHPFFAKTEADGGFRITGLPVGSYSVVVWHERSDTPLGKTAREIEAGGEAEVTFSLDVRAARARPGAHGMRKYE